MAAEAKALEALFGASPASPAPVAPDPLADEPAVAETGARKEVLFDAHNGASYLAPGDLCVTPMAPYRALAIGTCFLEGLLSAERGAAGHGKFDFVLVNNQARGAFSAPADIAAYDFQIVQLPVRQALGEVAAAQLPYTDLAAHEKLFADGCARLRAALDVRMKYCREAGLPSFVLNFLVPQFNPMGRLLPRYDLRNIEYYVARLNEELERLVRGYPNAHVLDVDRIAASLGRRHMQDDSVLFSGHGALLVTAMAERNRMEQTGSIAQHYDVAAGEAFAAAVIAEAEAMWRTVAPEDAVKLVVIDLDDTLWRGVSGDAEAVDHHMFAGWPYGFAEALLYLKKRGVLLAIVSKNDEARVREVWRKIVGRALRLEDFAALRINWRPKVENMAEILTSMRLLPRSVLFIDDNPAERAAMQAAFRDIRVLGRNPYYLRRILLLAPELQGTGVSEESARRTEMIHAQGIREGQRAGSPREDFLAQQEIVVSLGEIGTAEAPRFARAFELINKTNQFNTTGQRWTRRECAAHFAAGGVFVVYDVADRFAEYGLVGVVILRAGRVLQWVMSCRVIGMGVEQAVMAELVRTGRVRSGALVETDANLPCRRLFAECGFVVSEGVWTLIAGGAVPFPDHVTLESKKAGWGVPSPPAFSLTFSACYRQLHGRPQSVQKHHAPQGRAGRKAGARFCQADP